MTSSYCSPSPANFWFPTAPEITVLPSNPLPTVNEDPKPANYVNVPEGFNEEDPNLCDLFENILPREVDPVYPVEVTAPAVFPPYSEVVIYDLRIRKYLIIQSFDYSLNVVTEVGAITLKTKIIITPIKTEAVPAINIGLEASPPVLRLSSRLVGKVVEVAYYTGTGGTPQQLNTPWPASMMLLYSPGSVWRWFDTTRGNTGWSTIAASEYDISTDGGSLVFGEGGVTVQGNPVNLSNQSYRAYIFKGKREAISNTAGSIPTTVYESDAFNIVSYAGTGANAAIGHGLGEIPGLLIFKSPGGNGTIGGASIVANYFLSTSSDNSRSQDTTVISGFTDTVVNIGSANSVNALGQLHTCYAFKQKENQCKIDTYYGNGLASGQVIDCGFNAGVVLVKSLTSNGRWLLLNEKDTNQGFIAPSWRSGSDQVLAEKIYEFTGDDFKVFGTSTLIDPLLQLNRAGEQYLYMALAVGFYRKLNCPVVAINFQAYTPVIKAGASIAITVKTTNFLAVTPPYIGKRVTFVLARKVSIESRAYQPAVSSGANVSLAILASNLRVYTASYVGEVAQDGRVYVATVESRDGQSLESTMQGCIYKLIKDLKIAGLWDKFLTIVPTCVARTRTGALVPLRGRSPNTSSVTSAAFNYNRRTGLKPITTLGFSTGLNSNEVPAIDNHLAAYINELNSSSGGSVGNMIGDGFNTNSLAIGRPTSGSDFRTRNKDIATATLGAPGWSQPSIVGITRQSSSNYVLRAAGVNRTITSPIVDQTANVIFTPISIFNFSNATGNFRIPFYSIGTGLDLAVLEEIVEAFLERVRLIGLPDTRILAPYKEIQAQAIEPSSAGVLRRIQCPTAQQTISPGIVRANSGAAVAAPFVNILTSVLGNLYTGPAIPVILGPSDGAAFTLSGQDIALSVVIKLLAAPGAFTLTGQAANTSMAAEAGSFSVAGMASTAFVLRGFLAAESTSFNFGGQPIQLTRAASLEASTATCVLLGQDTSLRYEQGGVTISVGTQAPLLGSSSATDFTGWEMIQNASADDAFLEVSGWPFSFVLDNTSYTGTFVGSNGYLTFGQGSQLYNSLSAANPALPKIHFGAADISYQRVYKKIETETVRIRFEGTATTSGTPGSSNIIVEFAFFKPANSGEQVVELRIGLHGAVLTLPFMIANSTTSYASASPYAPNSSWVYVGNATGTAWTLTSNRYVQVPLRSLTMAAAAGNLEVTGQPSGLYKVLTVSPVAGHLSIDGQSARTITSLRLAAGPGAYSLIGENLGSDNYFSNWATQTYGYEALVYLDWWAD